MPVSVQRARKAKGFSGGPPAGWWGSTLENVPLGTAQYVSGSPNATSAALDAHWTWFGQPGQESLYGLPDIVSAAAEGIAAPPGGDRVLKLHHALGDTAVHHKVFKMFFGYNWTDGVEAVPNDWAQPSPASASARYVVYMYMPLAAWFQQYNAWVNAFQLKQRVITNNGNSPGGDYQDPYWWAEIRPGGGGTSGYRINMQSDSFIHSSTTIDMTPYFDKWVKWEMRVTQGVKVEFYLDGVLKDTGTEAQTHCGLWTVGSTYLDGQTITANREWIFGCGNYTSNQSQSGPGGNEPDSDYGDTTIYIDWAWIEPL